jgi:hypothetical protein
VTCDAYISYTKPDAAWVRVLAARLGEAGLRIFLDEQEISLGQVIIDRLEHGIAGVHAGLVVFSDAAVTG